MTGRSLVRAGCLKRQADHRLDASPSAAASRSSLTRSPAPAARTPTGCRSIDIEHKQDARENLPVIQPLPPRMIPTTRTTGSNGSIRPIAVRDDPGWLLGPSSRRAQPADDHPYSMIILSGVLSRVRPATQAPTADGPPPCATVVALRRLRNVIGRQLRTSGSLDPYGNRSELRRCPNLLRAWARIWRDQAIWRTSASTRSLPLVELAR
jgi:hypothetical protein